jgi:MerR family transcriptional regulator, aldehyde-responsive regulator
MGFSKMNGFQLYHVVFSGASAMLVDRLDYACALNFKDWGGQAKDQHNLTAFKEKYTRDQKELTKSLDLELPPGDTLFLRGETMKIAEVSEKHGLSVDTLRYYERIGLIPHVGRSESGIRDYNELDVRRVDFIKCMRGAGLSIEVLIEYMDLVQRGDSTIETRKEILREQRDLVAARLQEMQKTLDLLNHKIQVYENAILTKEKQIVQTEE